MSLQTGLCCWSKTGECSRLVGRGSRTAFDLSRRNCFFVIHSAVLGQCARRAVGSAPTPRRVHWSNNVLGNRTSVALRMHWGASPHPWRPFQEPLSTDERELIPTGLPFPPHSSHRSIDASGRNFAGADRRSIAANAGCRAHSFRLSTGSPPLMDGAQKDLRTPHSAG